MKSHSKSIVKSWKKSWWDFHQPGWCACPTSWPPCCSPSARRCRTSFSIPRRPRWQAQGVAAVKNVGTNVRNMWILPGKVGWEPWKTLFFFGETEICQDQDDDFYRENQLFYQPEPTNMVFLNQKNKRFNETHEVLIQTYQDMDPPFNGFGRSRWWILRLIFLGCKTKRNTSEIMVIIHIVMAGSNSWHPSNSLESCNWLRLEAWIFMCNYHGSQSPTT